MSWFQYICILNRQPIALNITRIKPSYTPTPYSLQSLHTNFILLLSLLDAPCGVLWQTLRIAGNAVGKAAWRRDTGGDNYIKDMATR